MHRWWNRSGDGAPELCRNFFRLRRVPRIFAATKRFSAVELQDRSDSNLPEAPVGVCLLAVVFVAAQLAFNLDMTALGERLGELRKLAEDDATVPFGVRNVLAVLLVGGPGCERKSGKAAVRVSAGFCVGAQKAEEYMVVSVC